MREHSSSTFSRYEEFSPSSSLVSSFIFPEERTGALNKSIAKVEAQSSLDTWVAELQGCRGRGSTLSYAIYKPSSHLVTPLPSLTSLPPMNATTVTIAIPGDGSSCGDARHPISRSSDAQEFTNWIFPACSLLLEAGMYR